jgi:hypothetical protein
METLEERKDRIRATRNYRQRKELNDRIEGPRRQTRFIVITLAVAAFIWLLVLAMLPVFLTIWR